MKLQQLPILHLQNLTNCLQALHIPKSDYKNICGLLNFAKTIIIHKKYA